MDSRLRTSISQILQRLIESRVVRFILFLATFLLSLISGWFIIVGDFRLLRVEALGILFERWLRVANLVYLLIFPFGLFNVLFSILNIPSKVWGLGHDIGFFGFPPGLIVFSVIGWLIYIVVVRVGIITPQRRVFILTYIAFILMLIANIAGCQLAHPNTTYPYTG